MNKVIIEREIYYTLSVLLIMSFFKLIRALHPTVFFRKTDSFAC